MCKIVFNNRNRLTTTKNMVEKLLSINQKEEIIIIDNDSSYPPLLEWYSTLPENVKVLFNENLGHLALWRIGLDKELGEHFIYTDADIILPSSLPLDWKEIMFDVMNRYPEYNKVALALNIGDLPEHYRYKYQVMRNEGSWWLDKVEDNVFKADTDTTFALMKNFNDNCYKSLRIARPDMICRHHGWYLNLEELDEEELYYIEHLETSKVTTQYSKQHKDPSKYTDI